MTNYKNSKGEQEPSPRGKRAIGLILSGEAKSMAAAARKAGYAPSTSRVAAKDVFKTKGVIAYLKRLNAESQKKFGLVLQDKVMKTYFEGLDATKLYGKNAIKHPDFRVRIEAADRFAKFFRWVEGGFENPAGKFNQFNFFNVDPAKQKQFHENLRQMVRRSYPPSAGGVPANAK